MPDPFFSVIVPTYNHTHFIGETIESVLNQTFKDFELIIVDDGSTDNTKEVINKYLSDSRVKYIYQENKERGAARNTGGRWAEGMYLNFLDSDDLLLPFHLELIHEFIKEVESKDIAVLHTDTIAINESGNQIPTMLTNFEGDILSSLMKGNLVCINTLIVRKDVFNEIQFNEDRSVATAEDWEFMIRLANKHCYYYLPKQTVITRDHKDRSSYNPIVAESSKLAALNKIFSNQELLSKISKYKKYAYGHGYLYISIAYYADRQKIKALKWLKKAVVSYPKLLLSKRIYATLLRIALPSQFKNIAKDMYQWIYKTKNIKRKN